MLNNKTKQFIAYYLPVIIWAGVIFYFSSIPNLRTDPNSIMGEIIIRKAGHVIEFVILFWLIWRIAHYVWNMTAGKAIAVSFVIASFYAVSDEWHQRFVIGRTGKLEDVTFDILSVLLGMQLIAITKLKRLRKYALLAALIIISIISTMGYRMIVKSEREKEAEDNKIKSLEVTNQEEEAKIANEEAADSPQEKPAVLPTVNLPAKIKIDVPFTSQAPLGVWDAYHEEACEEASVIMMKYYLDNKKLSSDTAEKEIQTLIKFEIDKYGDYKDSNADQIVKMAHDFYGINNLKVAYNFKREDIKKYLALGKPIIIPAAGRLLGNPNYTAPGPLYHALVLTGYDGNNIITNDPGTKKGQGYTYDINILYNAIHDFPGKPEDIEQGKKAMIILP